MAAAAVHKVNRERFRFSLVDSAGAFLVREHFEDFQTTIQPELGPRGIAIRAFHEIIDSRGAGTHLYDYRNHKLRNLPTPMDGVIVKDRTDLGLEPYQGSLYKFDRGYVLRNFAINTGSLVVATAFLADIPNSLAYERAIISMTSQLEAQIKHGQ